MQQTVAIDARLISGSSTGDSTYWSGLLYGLSRMSLPIRILLITDKPRPVDVPDMPGIDWIVAPAKNSRWWSLVRFPLIGRKNGATAFHVQYSMSPLVGDRGISTIHDVSFFIGPQWFKPQDRAILTRTVPAAVKRAAKVITVSETSRREIEKFIPAAKGKTVATPLACPPWIYPTPRDEAHKIVAERFGLKGPFALTTGTRWPRKNMQLAIDAMAGLDSEIPHQLAVAGKIGWGDLQPNARVKLLGYVDRSDLCALYSAADIYLAPSLHEGFGIPPIEAMRCGAGVICSEGGALPETVAMSGMIVPSWKADDWTRVIADVLGDASKLADLRARAASGADRFSWDVTARRTLAVYEEVMR